MHIQESTDPSRWNRFAANHPDATCYHLFGWKRCLEKSYGLDTLYIEAITENRVCGIFPLALVGLKGFFRIAVSLPFCSYGGPIAISNDLENELINEVQNILRTRYRDVKSIELRRIGSNANARNGLVTMMRELPGDPEILWKSLRDKERNQVRKARRNGLDIRWSKEHVGEFHRIYAKNMHILGTPAHPVKWFHNILNAMPENTDLITVWKDETVMSGMLIFKFDDTICNPYASSLKEFNSFGPNTLMYWEVLKFGCENGFRYFDFGRSRADDSNFSFKKHWGGIPFPLNYQAISLSGSESRDSDARYAGRKMQSAARCWSRIPYSLSLLLGPKIRKYIP